MTKTEFKELFLKLTEYTIPFGTEKKLEKYLPTGFKKDSVGNYFYEIGESETLFTTHLDTYSEKYEKVNHVIDADNEYHIRTDGKTILGGDNKLGCCILIGMIKNNIPGTYYFFLGEEPIISGGLWGSSSALTNNPEFFTKFKRCIAFDRRGYGSVVIRQMGRMTSSNEFIQALSSELRRFGSIEFDESSKYGYYTDTATFMDVIPECTNISAGGFDEHYESEWVDLNYTYNVYKTALQIKWEDLPVRRKIGEVRFSEDSKISKVFRKFLNYRTEQTSSDVKKAVERLDKLVLTREILTDGTKHLTYSMWLKDYDIDIWVRGADIFIDKSLRIPVTLAELLQKIKKESKLK